MVRTVCGLCTAGSSPLSLGGLRTHTKKAHGVTISEYKERFR
jgi:hypothetical protein